MFNFVQRRRIREALLKRANEAGLTRKQRAGVLRVAYDSATFDLFVEEQAKSIRKRKGMKFAADGELLKLILEWISNGGLDVIWAFIEKIIDKISN